MDKLMGWYVNWMHVHGVISGVLFLAAVHLHFI